MNDRILLVDDDQNVLRACKRGLHSRFSVHTALGGAEAISLIENERPFATIVSDMRMPGMDGIQFLKEARRLSPDSIRMMLTGNADLETAMEAVNGGAVFRFITKPCASDDLADFIAVGIRQYQLVTSEQELLENTLQGAVEVCTQILAGVDPRSHGLAIETRDLTCLIASMLGLERLWELELAAMLAQIGKATIPPVVAQRVRRGCQLTAAEQEMIRKVPEVGHELLASIPRLEGVAEIVLHADDRFDLPEGGQGVPVEARLLKVVSDFVQLRSLGEFDSGALEAMEGVVGAYDPRMLDALSTYIDTISTQSGESIDVSVAELQIGDRLKVGVETEDDNLLVAAGTTLTPALLKRIQNFGKVGPIREPITVHRRVQLESVAVS